MTAIERMRAAIAAATRRRTRRFSIPVYDGARRFDVVGRILPESMSRPPASLRVELTLRPIAGFKGESSETATPTTRRARSR